MYKVTDEKYEKLGNTTRKKIGNTVYVVRAYANKNATKTAQELLMEIGEQRLRKDLESGEFYRRLADAEQKF